MRIVIIGNGPAAINAVEEIRKGRMQHSVTMVSKEEELSYNSCVLAHYVSGAMPKEKLYTRTALPVLSIGVKNAARTVKRHDTKGIRKLYFTEDYRLAGISMIGDVSKGGIYLSMIQKGVYVDEAMDVLSPGVSYGLMMPGLTVL
jgi:NAD(P)H-nitrite reductase large subunit